MSTMRLTLPSALYRLMVPSTESTVTTTRLGTGRYDATLRSDALGTGDVFGPGYTVMKVPVVALTAVTLATIAVGAPAFPSWGMPSIPVTSMLRAVPPDTVALAHPVVSPPSAGLPFWVLQTRKGLASGVNCLPVVAWNQPAMSTAPFTEPAPFQIETSPTVPVEETGTMTRFGTAVPGLRLRLEASGLLTSAGEAVR